MEKTKRNNQKGITLIALVITIIVLIILAGISIMMISGQDGILSRAGNAKEINIAGQEKEQIQLAYSAALIDTKGTKITAENFQTELNKYAEATVTENADGSFNIVFTKTNNSYTFDSGNFVEGSGSSINWEEILADANSNPDKYKSENQSSTNGDIGIGTDGKPVNLDLWTYEVINGNEIKLSRGISCDLVAGYDKNNIVNGQIIGKVPQYIKISGKNEFYLVTNMGYTFSRCSSLTTAPEIPNSVTNMSDTFSYCSILTTAPEIPASVTSMVSTFEKCYKLEGTIVINANPKNYGSCFKNAATEGSGLKVTGSSNKLDELIATGNSNYIKKGE